MDSHELMGYMNNIPLRFTNALSLLKCWFFDRNKSISFVPTNFAKTLSRYYVCHILGALCISFNDRIEKSAGMCYAWSWKSPR